MVYTDLVFNKTDKGNYKAVTQSCCGVLQLERTDVGRIALFCNLSGCNKIPVYTKEMGKDFIVELDLPEGLELTIVSDVEVLHGVIGQNN